MGEGGGIRRQGQAGQAWPGRQAVRQAGRQAVRQAVRPARGSREAGRQAARQATARQATARQATARQVQARARQCSLLVLCWPRISYFRWIQLFQLDPAVSAKSRRRQAMAQRAQGWEAAFDVLNTAIATDAEVSGALDSCLNLGVANVPCESSTHSRLHAALRRLVQYQTNEWIRSQAGRVLLALGPVTGGIARVIKSGDARSFDSVAVRQAAYSFAIPGWAAASGNAAVQAVSACNDTLPGGTDTVPGGSGAASVSRPAQEQVHAESSVKGKMVLEPTMGSGSSRMHLELDLGAGDMHLELDLGAGEAGESVESRGRRSKKRQAAEMWEPGQDTRGWLGRGGKRLEPQTQVLLVNGFKRLKRLSFQTRRKLQNLFPPPRGTTAATTLAAQILAGLFAIPARTIEETVRHVQCRRFQPGTRGRIFQKARAGQPTMGTDSAPQAAQADPIAAVRGPDPPLPAASAGGDPPLLAASAGDQGSLLAASAREDLPLPGASTGDQGSPPAAPAGDPGPPVPPPAPPPADPPPAPPPAPPGFVNTLRAAMFVAAHGLPKSCLPDVLYLISAAGGALHGPQGRALCDTAEHAASACLTAATLKDLLKPLPGTGRPPDVEVIADAGSIGQYFGRVRDTIFFLGVLYSTAEPPYSREALIACINAGADERGPAIVAKMGRAFETFGVCPGSWKNWWNMLVAVASGDGALVRGGPAAKHNSTAAMNKIWTAASEGLRGDARKERATWDGFHLFDKAGSAALTEHETGNTLFNLLKRLEWLLGMGQGRIVDKGCAEHLGLHWLGCKSPAGHRKIGYLAGVPDRYIKKFANFYHSLLVRLSKAWNARQPNSRAGFRHVTMALALALDPRPPPLFPIKIM